ncbi:hypothetical protein [Pseudobutyrivibrio sp.]|jgi:hypothetical protein|uniref:hypothetical protein n=1 Tax=Pseudobutyrivibrio sp. TaxID=2014367 RepID=UPI0025D116B0|nr:hypothetical protein [Pseudobutyrivibrio sp.]
MKNKKTSLIIVCSLVIMAFFFSLPVIVLKSSDAISDGKIYTSDIKTIEFGKKIDTESLIYLIINGIRMETPESEMNLEADNLRSTIKDSLSSYYENGLITEDFDDYSIRQYWSYRVYSDSDSNISGAYWVIDMQTQSFPKNYLFLTIDDETGKILLITYVTEESTYDVADLETYHEKLFETYSEDVGIKFDDYYDEGSFYNRNTKQYYVETAYGRFCLNFYLTDYGFNVSPGIDTFE